MRHTPRDVARVLASVVACATLFCSCRPPPPTESVPAVDPSAVEGGPALQAVDEFVAVGPRVSGSQGAERAAAYISEKLRKSGLRPETDIFTAGTPVGEITFRNVTATVRGRGNSLVVMVSHYDTKAGISDSFVGANDSGSSTGLLLYLADLLARNEPMNVNVMFAFVDGEECIAQYGPNDGLHGSRRLAALLRDDERLGNVRAVIVLDMIGDRNLTVTVPRNSTPDLMSLVFAAAHDQDKRRIFSLSEPILDDHVPFIDAGMPAVDIIDFEYGSAPGKNDYWHTDGDTLDKLSSASLQTVGRIVISLLNRLSAGRP